MDTSSESKLDLEMAAALGRVPSGLFVITVGEQGKETGMLASWLQQCSFDPPQVSLAVKSERPISALLHTDTVFTVNILGTTHKSMLSHFGKGFAPGEPAFEDIEVHRLEGAPPALHDALAYLTCRVSARHPAGDHDLVIGRVLAGKLLTEDQPMTHVRKNGLRY